VKTLGDVRNVQRRFSQRLDEALPMTALLLEECSEQYVWYRDKVLAVLCAELGMATDDPNSRLRNQSYDTPLGAQAQDAFNEWITWLMETDENGGYASL